MSSFFNVVASLYKTEKSKAYLIHNSWDDAFKFETSYTLHYFDSKGIQHEIGPLKIGEFGMGADQRTARIEKTFDRLSTKFFSLGQTSEYYQNIYKLRRSERRKILNGLRDFTTDDRLFSRAQKEPVTRLSLLRFVSTLTVKEQFKRILTGGLTLSKFHFKYQYPKEQTTRSSSLEFEVVPNSNPPTNIHVVIGGNGVGKTRLMNNMASSLLGKRSSQQGRFKVIGTSDNDDLFANLVYVTFSAFDKTGPTAQSKAHSQSKIKFSYVGLRKVDENASLSAAPKDLTMLTDEFVESAIACASPLRFDRWQKALKMLETDIVFKESDIRDFPNTTSKWAIEQWARKSFEPLSSGHKIVLLSITKLVEKVEERTLVLLDEPEVHLHPPLLSAFTRALSDLVINRNGVAIIATHSPVVLQEVPRSCVWKLRKVGKVAIAERLEIETFGENVGLLTQEVFGLEVTQAGFHRLLQRAADDHNDLESALSSFKNELGQEARAILRTMLYLKTSGKRK